MASKFVILAAFAAVARAGLIGSPLVAQQLATPVGVGIGSPLLARSVVGSPLGLQQQIVGSPLLSRSVIGAPLGLQQQIVGSPLLSRSVIGAPLGLQQQIIGAPLARSVVGAGVLGAPLGLAPQQIVGSPLLARSVVGAPLGLAQQQLIAAHGPVVSAPIAKTVVGAAVDTDYDPNPSYSYAYDVQDVLTGDSKNQQESRQGDVVQGSYSLTEPDGTRRTVEYTADPVNGFNAVVHREPLAVAKTVVAAPAIAKIATPLIG